MPEIRLLCTFRVVATVDRVEDLPAHLAKHLDPRIGSIEGVTFQRADLSSDPKPLELEHIDAAKRWDVDREEVKNDLRVLIRANVKSACATEVERDEQGEREVLAHPPQTVITILEGARTANKLLQDL